MCIRDRIHTESRFVTPRKELAYLAFAPSNIEVEFEGTPTVEPAKENSENDVEVIDLTAEGEASEDVDMLKPAESETQVVTTQLNEDTVMNDVIATEPMVSSTRVAKISTDQLENALEMGRQQDVTECIGNVLFQLESASDPINLDSDGEQRDLIKELFFGKLKQDLAPLKDPSKIRTKIERFVSLLVNVGDHPKNVYDALDQYFKDDVLQLEDGDVKRTLAIKELPVVLQIQIQRVYYDREKFMPFKSIEPLPFRDTIYMDRYMDTQDAEMQQKRQEAAKYKNELESLKLRQKALLEKNGNGMSFKTSLLETERFLESGVLEQNAIEIQKKDSALKAIESMLLKIDNELSEIYSRITACLLYTSRCV